MSKKRDDVEFFSLSTKKYNSQVPSWFKTLWSKSIFGLHGVVVAVIIFAVVVLLLIP